MRIAFTTTFLFAVGAAIVSTLTFPQANAAQRTHVSAAFGVDTNTATDCTPIAPCRTFQAAMTVTDPNGEVVVLDSGGYGGVTITQSVALIAPKGVYAVISVFPDAHGVTIATPGINVVLRGLTINGQGGISGINVSAANRLTIENCVISNLTEAGIIVNGPITVRVSDTIIRDNGLYGIAFAEGTRATITRATISGHRSSGVVVQGVSAATTTVVDIAYTTLNENGVGFNALSVDPGAAIRASIRDSRVVRNVAAGLIATSGVGAAVNLSASNNIIANNGIGIRVLNAELTTGGAKVWVSDNTVIDNSNVGLENRDATFESAGNNAVRNNGINKSGIITVVKSE